MKITGFDYIRTIVPDGSCGTGYSQPDEFEVEYETENEVSFKNVYIDLWYRPVDCIKKEFLSSMNRYFDDNIDNIEEAFEMYAKKIAKKSHLHGLCPYTFEEIMNANKF